MADVKITALTAIGANPVNPATFPMPMVDLLDPSQATSGSTKKVTVNQILGAGGTATLASATITGAATVGTTLGVTGVSTLTGNVGVGNAPSAWTLTAVQVGKGSIYGSGNETGYLGNAYYGSSGFKYIAAAGASFYQQNGGVHQWYTAAAGAAPNDPVTTFTTAKMALSAAGDLSLANGNLVMGTSGKGIDFSAVTGGTGTATANVLNDYEEGTWIGTLTGGTTTPGSPQQATGRYTKIGRQVSISINFESISTVGYSGNIGISGLPFTNNASVQSIGPTSIYQTGTFTGSPFIRVDTSASAIEFFASVSNAVYSNVTHNAGTGRFIATSVSYTVA